MPVRRIAATVFALPLGLLPALSLSAQQSAGPEPAEVLVLGTFHFANPGLDVVKTEVADVLSPTKQAEIAAVVEAVARFRPTKVAIERRPESSSTLDSLYGAYRAGQHELSRSESQQLGFRLADSFDHERLYPIDHGGDFPFGPMMEYAQVHDTAFVAFVEADLARIAEESNRRQRENTIGEILRIGNEPTKLAADHGTYLRFAGVGAGDTYVGAELVAAWYERNIKIFANLRRLAEPGDRILVIFGTGHAPTLREMVTYDPDMVLVETLDYLPASQ